MKHLGVRLNPLVVFRYLARPPSAPEGWIIAVNSLEDLVGGHFQLWFYLLGAGLWHVQSVPIAVVVMGYTWSGEAYLSYSLTALAFTGLIAATFSWYNNTAYPSKYFGPTAGEASQSQSFTFLVRDQRLRTAG